MTVRMKMDEAHTPPGTVAVVLGRIQALSVREIEITLQRAGYDKTELSITSGVALVKAQNLPDETWFRTLGGSVKFGRVVAECPTRIESVVETLQQTFEPSDRIGLSILGATFSPRKLAGELKQAGLTRRYVLPQQGQLLTGAQSKQFRSGRDLELLILGQGELTLIIQITAVQDIDDFTKRDRFLPAADARRGMLPTKLARTMVNLGLGFAQNSSQPVLLDPFCGTGRVLMEGILLESAVWGADIDPVAVKATVRNLEWTAAQYHLPSQSWEERVVTAPITKLGELLAPASIDAIVTEPDLGPPQQRALTPAQATELFNRLEPMYLALLAAGQTVLKPTGGLVVAFPTVERRSLFDRVVDKLARFGYHVDDSIRVSRPDQFISRTVAILRRTDGA